MSDSKSPESAQWKTRAGRSGALQMPTKGTIYSGLEPCCWMCVSTRASVSNTAAASERVAVLIAYALGSLKEDFCGVVGGVRGSLRFDPDWNENGMLGLR